ncbi:methyltransferase [Streptomyces abyssalis]|uniref:Methyltransferase n=1 Tax=Streptomyces abyssalis TaxID=933944 RepID=A0A1E7JSN8_9ACTN|nr:SAM-dependent methyltransferase [Streptomyces abyssalis]OEU91913.1 methyltransferase [Streptomyces abyssalis]OEU93944.1 methyltransferase [Streptomyces abyssalis]
MTANDEIDISRPHPARVYDYWLNGKSHYEADAAAAERVVRVWPGVVLGARLNREFMHRATRWLANEAGVRQFLDIGSGIPTEPNLHQVAQAVAPETRAVYVDNDPIVLAHAQELLSSTPQGRTAYLQADFTEPESILASPELGETLDLGRPVALSLIALLHFITDERGAYDIVRRYMDALPSGSYLVVSHATADFDPDLLTRVAEAYQSTVAEGQIRSSSEVNRFFEGLELVDPGVVVAHRWRHDGDEAQADITDAEFPVYGGVARKP